MEGTPVIIDVLNPDHMPEVVEIDRRSVRPAWNKRSFEDEFAVSGSRSWVLLAEGRILGYIITRVIIDEAELMRIAIAPEARGLGYGSLLLERTLKTLSRENVKQLYLEVRTSNAVARRFYEKHRFEVAGCRRLYYSDPERTPSS